MQTNDPVASNILFDDSYNVVFASFLEGTVGLFKKNLNVVEIGQP